MQGWRKIGNHLMSRKAAKKLRLFQILLSFADLSNKVLLRNSAVAI
jgi:hypothetical protein